jgi:hypothetical protein
MGVGAQPVDPQLGGRVAVLGEPDEGDRVVVDECVDFQEVRELLGLPEPGGVPVGGILALAPVLAPQGCFYGVKGWVVSCL